MAVGKEPCSGMNLDRKKLSAELLYQWIKTSRNWISPEVVLRGLKSSIYLVKSVGGMMRKKLGMLPVNVRKNM
jgi:hypothetical protein